MPFSSPAMVYTKQADTPFSHGLLDGDLATRRALRTYLKIVIMSTVLISLTIWSILSIYWGANWRVFQGVHKMNGWIVDFDDGSIGNSVTQAYLSVTGPKEQISWYTVPASEFPNGENDIPNAVINERTWVAIVVSAGASDRLTSAINAGSDSGFNNSAAVTIYAAEARNENSYLDFLLPLAEAPIQNLLPTFALQQVQSIGAQRAGQLLTSAPLLVVSPLNYTVNNLRPFDLQVAEAIDFVGLIYLLILSFIAALANFQGRTMMSGLENRLRLFDLIVLRIVVPLAVYFVLSLVYALLSLFFHAAFTQRFGHAGFVIYWMLSWAAMLALGLAIEAMITILTARFIPFFLVPWIIVNVSVAYYPVEILPTIFRYGYATPFYNVSRATRTILFRTRDQVGLNFGVLFAWIGVSLITIPLFQWFMRRRQVKQWEARQADTMSDTTTTQAPVEAVKAEGSKTDGTVNVDKVETERDA